MDPLSAATAASGVITAIASGLKLVDQFRDLALRFRGTTPQPPGAIAERKDDTIQIRRDGNVVQQITSQEMDLDQWDAPRYNALLRRVSINWGLYNELFAQGPLLSVDEQARIKMRMEGIKAELCVDFREMVAIYERTMGTSLPDHYQLYEVCPN